MKKQTLLVAIAGLLGAALVVGFLLTGCQAGTTGTFRPIDPNTYTALTNDVAQVVRVAGSAAPFPWNSAAQGLGAGIIGILAAWQTITHRAVQKNTAAIAAQNGQQKVSPPNAST